MRGCRKPWDGGVQQNLYDIVVGHSGPVCHCCGRSIFSCPCMDADLDKSYQNSYQILILNVNSLNEDPNVQKFSVPSFPCLYLM